MGPAWRTLWALTIIYCVLLTATVSQREAAAAGLPAHVRGGPKCDPDTLSVEVGPEGKVDIALCGDRYAVESGFSYPGMQPGGWHSFGPPSARAQTGG